METKIFNTLLTRRLSRTKEVLAAKGSDYARNGDRLYNFKVAATINPSAPISPEQALLGMWRKHLVSILDMIEDVSEGKKVTREYLDEKIGDSINYHILLEGLIVESRIAPVENGFANIFQEENNIGEAKEVKQ